MSDRGMPRSARVAVIALLFVGAGLRLWQYLANASLWIDEIALAENVLRRPLSALLREPLALDQVAPPGFLALARASTAVFGESEMALRLVPLASGLLALALFPRLSRRFQPAWIEVLATALFALYPTLVRYSAEFKPYSTDLAAAMALTLIAFGLGDSDADKSSGRFLRAALFGGAAVWFSQTAVFMVAGLGASLVVLALTGRPRRLSPRLIAVLAVWTASAAAAVATALDRVPPSMREYFDRVWEPSLPSATTLLLLVVAGVALWIRSRRAAVLLLGPVAVTLLAAGTQLYPFSGRAILFLMPVWALAVAECSGRLVEGLVRIRLPRPVASTLPAIALAVVVVRDLPPYRAEEMRPVLANLARRRLPGDQIYVYYPAEPAYRFYGPRAALSLDDTSFGRCHRGEPRRYLRELDAFRGQPRVWVVRTHVYRELFEADILDGYLGRMGNRKEALLEEGAEAVLWDLSNAGALPADAAETHPLPAWDQELSARLGCGHGPIGARPPDWK
jgi:Dolichyl-phosphate-mannose-protein mannosyltransferase